MTRELNKFVLTDANLSEILNKVMPYIEELQLDNHNEPNAGILYDYKLEEALIGLRKILYHLENKSQQPILQDINKWIEDEKNDFYNRFTIPKVADGVKIGFEKCAQLLLPELEQLRDKAWALEGVVKDQKSEIEQQKEEIERLNGILEATKAVIKNDRKEIEQQKETIETLSWDVNRLAIDNKEQAAEIESLKKEKEMLFQTGHRLPEEIQSLKAEHFTDKHLSIIKTKQKAGLQWLEEARNADYWKQKFESSGKWGDDDMIAFLKFALAKKGEWFNHDKPEEIFTNWQTLKQQTHG